MSAQLATKDNLDHAVLASETCLRQRLDEAEAEVARQRRELDAHVSDDSRHLAPGAAGQPDQSGHPDKGA